MRLLAVLLVVGCPKKPVSTVDLDLPEERPDVERLEPLALLEAMAAEQEISLRGRALQWLVRLEDPATWGPRALHDPDGWVQRVAAAALLERGETEMLVPYVERASADPYVRAWVAMRLESAPIEAAWKAETDPYRAAPLAYAALSHGHAALEPLMRAVSRGELALEEDFVRDLGACRSYPRMPQGACEDVLGALREGEAWVEEELHLAYGAARVRLDDKSGEQVLRKGLGGDLRLQVATVDQLAELETPEAEALLRKAGSSSEELTAVYAGLVAASREDGSIERFVAAAEHPTVEIRTLALRFAGERLARGQKKNARQLEQLIVNGAADLATEVRQAALEAAVHADLDERALYQAALVDESPVIRILGAGGLLQQGA